MANKDVQFKHDTMVLKKLGYAQELFREMGWFSNFAIAFSTISVLTGLIQLYGYGVGLVGGASFWTWVLVAVFQLFNAMSMGEIASSFPLAGGVYPWARRLGNPHWGWFAGCINLVGWWGSLVGIEFGLATFICGSGWFGLVMNIPTIILVAWALLIIHMVMNIYGIKLVAWFNNFSVWIIIAGSFLLFAALLTLGHAHPISIINDTAGHGGLFTHTFWLAFLPAILMSAWTLNSMDAAANVSEETHDPQQRVPWGLTLSVIVSFVTGAMVLIALNVALPPAGELTRATHTTTVAVYIIQKVMGGYLGTLMLAVIVLAQFACGLATMTVYQRIIFALARDRNLPFARSFRYVHPKYGTPYSAAIGGTILAMALAGVAALPIITSVSTIGLNASYGIVIAIAIWARFKGKWAAGPWNLGRYGLYIFGGLAVIYNIFVCIVVSFSPDFKALEIMAGVLALLVFYYIFSMRKQLDQQCGRSTG
jgi:amino acid transporter